MAAVTLATLRTRVRERADMPTAGFIADSSTSLDAFINEGAQRLHERLIDSLGEEYVSSTSTITTASGTSDYAVPSDFFRLYGVDLTIHGKVRTLKPFGRNERNYFRNATNNANWLGTPRYSLVGGNVRLYPIPQGVYSGSILYAPTITVLSSTSDTVNFPNGLERMVVLYAAIQCLIKEESDYRPLQRLLDQEEAALDELKYQRDAAFPKKVTDMDVVDYIEFY